MRTIDIQTTQKVTIEYELAPLQNRILAFILDILIFWISAGMFMSLLVAIFDGSGFNNNVGELIGYLGVPLIVFYTLISEILMDGQTIGKKALGIKVIKLNGDAPVASDYIIRWIFRLVDIWFSIGTLAMLLISSSNSNQRLGGLASGTAVIKVKTDQRFKLADILKIQNIENYQPTYPEVRRLNEQDMLMVKTAIARMRMYRNDAHKKVIIDLCKHLTEVLELKEVPRNKMKFLKTLITDYIVLTR